MTREERRTQARYRRALVLVRDHLTEADTDQMQNQVLRTVDAALGEPHRRACRCGFCRRLR
jgi:hypothetical protein